MTEDTEFIPLHKGWGCSCDFQNAKNVTSQRVARFIYLFPLQDDFSPDFLLLQVPMAANNIKQN